MFFQLDMQHLTPGSAVLGGTLIGVSAGALALGSGRIAGISGILGSTLNELALRQRPADWKLAFLAGIVLASLIWAHFAPVPGATFGSSWLVIGAAGTLVGFGTRMGSGCASGHGVCGLARMSWRSAAAVLVFMGVAMAVATLRTLLN